MSELSHIQWEIENNKRINRLTNEFAEKCISFLKENGINCHSEKSRISESRYVYYTSKWGYRSIRISFHGQCDRDLYNYTFDICPSEETFENSLQSFKQTFNNHKRFLTKYI